MRERKRYCRVCHAIVPRSEASGLPYYWTCHRCRSKIAAESRARTQPPPGWMRDPGNSSRERWWDGQEWTHHTR